MSLEGYGLILLTRMSMLMLFTSVSVLILSSSDAVMILPAGFFVDVLTLIWSILMVEFISKVPDYNGINH